MNNYHSGHFAEFLAMILLMFKGYFPIARNFSCGQGTGAGEIDLIMRRGKTLVFIEVKKRIDLRTAAFSILSKQRERVRRCAEAFLQQNPQYADFTIRFDAFLVKFPFSFRHIKNAF